MVRAACCPLPHWQTERQPHLMENAAKAKEREDCELVRPVDLGDLVDLVDLVTGGLQRNLNCALLIFKALMRLSSVDGGTPSFAAAPDEPPTRPRHATSAASMLCRSLSGPP